MWGDDMGERRIVVRIAPDGAIHAETLGIKGEACLDYIEVLEDLLDAEAVQSEFTAEYTESTFVDQEVNRDVRQW